LHRPAIDLVRQFKEQVFLQAVHELYKQEVKVGRSEMSGHLAEKGVQGGGMRWRGKRTPAANGRIP
jgi:hypothetical protein